MLNKLLLADDSLTIQKVVELVLVHENFEIKAVNDGEQALALIETFVPDIVLADIEMPKLNGYELCEKIKNNMATASIPVVLLAGAFEPFDEEYAKTVGADDFIIKPFESQELISKVKSLLINIAPVKEAVEEEEEPGLHEDESPDNLVEPVPEPVPDVSAMSDVERQWAEEMAAADEPVIETATVADDEYEAKMALISDVKGFDEELKEALQEETPTAPQVTAQVSLQLPSQEDIADMVKKAVEDQVSRAMESDVIPQISSVIKDAVARTMQELAPAIIEKTTRELVTDMLDSLRGEIHSAIGRIVPEVADTIIRKEIEKISSEL
jgi:CheY-like chemotaxis protein